MKHLLFVVVCVCMLTFLFSPAFSQPTDRIDGGLFYFPPTQSLLTIGGWGPPDWNQLQEVWSLDASGWSAMPDIPEGVAHTSAAYDEANQRLIVMGGSAPDKSTWAFDGSSWTKVADPLTSEYGYDPELIYNPQTQNIVLYFAAMSWMPGEANPSDTYILTGQGWEKQTEDPAPPGAMDVGFVYDAARQEGVWFNGEETWVWKDGDWAQKSPATSPAYEFGQFAMAYDAAREEVVAYGKQETWIWDGQDWTKQDPPTTPDMPTRGFFAFGYDENRQVTVLFGGEVPPEGDGDATYADDRWEWNGQTWSRFGESKIENWILE